MTEELESLGKVIKKLEEGGFEYLLTGSMAMSFYSVLRMTRDSDIIILLYGKYVGKFVKLLSVEKKLIELYSKLTPEEKFKKMLSLCQTAREIMLFQMPKGLPEKEKRKRLFIAYYQHDFSKPQFEKILKNLFPE